jgi:hypothetical protein
VKQHEQSVTEELYRGVTSMEESVTYQSIIAKGAFREAKKILLRLGSKQFGAPDPQTLTILDTISDLDRLKELTDRLSDVSGWQELLKVPHAG